MMFGSKKIVGLVAAGIFALPMMASASVKSNQVDVDRVVINYAVEDMQTVIGMAAIEREIREAATLVCGSVDYGEVRSLKAVADNRTCYNGAVDRAKSQLGSGTLQVSAR
ncbi:MAG: UrcA family protein [Pseudomonadales bacterium]